MPQRLAATLDANSVSLAGCVVAWLSVSVSGSV